MIDIGLNLMSRQFEADREEIVLHAVEKGVCPLIITGTSLKESLRAAEYASAMPGKLYCTAGVHPHDAKSCNDSTMRELRKLAALPQVVAVGECGLDYDRDFSPRDVQREWFEKQVVLAEEMRLPLFLHERAAFKDFKEILTRHKEICSRSVVHCFTGDGAELGGYLKLGCYIGITGWICDERRGQHLRNLIKLIPLDRLMVETDAPFLLPRNLTEKPSDRRNEPAYLPHIVGDIAACLGRPYEEVARITDENTRRFFGI